MTKNKKFIENVINSNCITDKEKMMLLKLNSIEELKRLKKEYSKEKRITDYEAYSIMHNSDGIVGKPFSSSKL
jgi:hypothetical protein